MRIIYLYGYCGETAKRILIDFYFSTDQGKPITIMADIYVESFGNIEEANMVRKLCSLLFHPLNRLFAFVSDIM